LTRIRSDVLKVNPHIVAALLVSWLLSGGSLRPVSGTPLFHLVSFPVTGPGFAVPAIDERYIYVGSGYGKACQNTGEIRAFDKDTLELVWTTTVAGGIGDTTLTLSDDQIIFGAGKGVAALSKIWRRRLTGCFQESFISRHRRRIYLGSSSGNIYSLTLKGRVVWRQLLSDAVFAAPAVVGRTSGDIWRISRTGRIEAQYSSSDRYVASPIVCNGNIVVANLAGQVDWLEVATLQPRYTTNIAEPFLFGTPQCVNNTILVTGYDTQSGPSALYYLQQGQILKRLEFPCCKAALTTTMIDSPNVYNVLTTFDFGEEVDLARSPLALR
jgi:outer membrane protein assembly factor BamB